MADAIDPGQWRKPNGEFVDEVITNGLRRLVGTEGFFAIAELV